MGESFKFNNSGIYQLICSDWGKICNGQTDIDKDTDTDMDMT